MIRYSVMAMARRPIEVCRNIFRAQLDTRTIMGV
jgi:hypothetical protein